MSSQNDSGVPLTHAPDDVGYKLLELPPELVELLESDNPPVLTLEASDEAGLLKAGDKTYSLRQKNTSNSLILLKPTPSQSGSRTASAEVPEPPGMSAVATVHETIELVPEMAEAVKPAAAARGKWHEKFGKSR